MNADEFDRLFDDSVDMADHLDIETIERPNLVLQSVAVDLPTWVVHRLDRQAQTAGVTREAMIRLWLAERLSPAPQKAVAAE